MIFDEIFEYVGGESVYQVCLLLYNMALGLVSIDAPRMNFLGGSMSHWCKIPNLANFSHDQQKYIAIPDDSDGEPHACYRFDLDFSEYSLEELLSWNRTERTAGVGEVRCDEGWVYDQSQFVSSISSKWDLVCDKGWLVQMVSTCYMAGWLLGCIVIGPISDRFGRKKTVLMSHTIRCVGAFLCLYSPWYEVFAVGRLIMGLTSPHVNLTMFIIVAEITETKWRSTFLVAAHSLTFTVGGMVTPGVAYYVRDYFYMEAIFVWPLIYLFIFIIVLDESPRWLVSQRREEEAIKILSKVGTVNKGSGAVLPEDTNFKEEIAKRQQVQDARGSATIADLFKTPNIRKKTIIIWLTWFTLSLAYYGLVLNANRLPGSVYVNVLLLSAVEIPATIVPVLLLPLIGRRWVTGGATVLAGLALLLCIPFLLNSNLELVATGLAVFGQAAAATAFGGIYVYTAELNPTLIRNMALGTASMCARVSGMAAPFVGGPLADVWPALPSLLFGIFNLLSGSLIFLLPETLGYALPETLEEAEDFGKTGKQREPRRMMNESTMDADENEHNRVADNAHENFTYDNMTEIQTKF